MSEQILNIKKDLWNLNLALEEADRAYSEDEVPVGAIIIDPDGKVIASAHNQKEKLKDASAHAEVLALREASKKLNSWRLINCTLYSSLEPCSMCLSTILQFRVKRLVFSSYDYKGGAISLGLNLHRNSKLNHKISITGGLMSYESSKILSRFFKEKRLFYKK